MDNKIWLQALVCTDLFIVGVAVALKKNTVYSLLHISL